MVQLLAFKTHTQSLEGCFPLLAWGPNPLESTSGTEDSSSGSLLYPTSSFSHIYFLTTWLLSCKQIDFLSLELPASVLVPGSPLLP